MIRKETELEALEDLEAMNKALKKEKIKNESRKSDDGSLAEASKRRKELTL